MNYNGFCSITKKNILEIVFNLNFLYNSVDVMKVKLLKLILMKVLKRLKV